MNEKKITTVGIIGSGKMGTNIFYFLNDFDFNLVWICETEDEKEIQTASFYKKLNRSLKNNLINHEIYENQLNKTQITNSLNTITNCDLIIEAITENADAKRKLFTQIGSLVNNSCILSSNTSSIPPAEIFPENIGKNRVILIHFFYPVSLKNIVEIVPADFTTPIVTEKITAFLYEIGRKFILLNESNAFLLNRLFLAFQVEAFNISIELPVTYREIDNIIKKYIFPTGVFEMFDNIGLDVLLSSITNYSRLSSNPQIYEQLINCLDRMVKSGHLGHKTKKGFYNFLNSREDSENHKVSDYYEKNIYVRLLNKYLESANSFVNKGYCDKEVLNYAVKEYMGIDFGPFELPGVIR